MMDYELKELYIYVLKYGWNVKEVFRGALFQELELTPPPGESPFAGEPFTVQLLPVKENK